MKKSIFTLALIFVASISMAQKKQATPAKDTTKSKYNYYVLVPVNDYNQIANSLNEYKRLQMYDPIARPEQKVQLFQGIEAYLRDLPSRVKMDSVKITK